jgi:hypothetical protein
MIWGVITVLLLLWMFGCATHVAGYFTHTILVLAIITAFVHLAKNRKKGPPQKPPPLFLTEFEIYLEWDFPKHFALKNWAGLLLCQVIDKGATDSRLLAWWDSPASYNAYWAARFKADLVLKDPVFQGVVVQHKQEEEKLLEKVKNPVVLYSIFISSVALLTNITQIKTFADWAFATPEMELTPPKYPDIAVVGEPFPLLVNANNHTHADCEVLLAVPSVTPKEGLTIGEEGPMSRNLTAGGSIDVIYHLKAQAPGRYEVLFSGTQHSGQWRGWLPLQDRRCELEVWAPVDRHPKVEYGGLAGDGSAVFVVTARHGHPPSSIRYRAVAIGDQLSFTGVSYGKVVSNTHSGGVAVIVWEAEAFKWEPDAKKPHQTQDFAVRIKRETNTDEGSWKNLLPVPDNPSDKRNKFQVGAQYVEASSTP